MRTVVALKRSSYPPGEHIQMKANRLLTVLSIHVGIVLSGMALDASAQQANAMASGQMSMSAAKMMKNMSAPGYTGDTDADFVAHMIPHHQGAVDQAEVELKYGDDPQMRALARNIIKAQKEEIAFMKRWQARHDTNM